MDKLIFNVRGSSDNIYRVTFEGAGPTLKAFCTCPSFARGGKFCKHAAALLMGDVTRAENSEALPLLKERAAGTDLYYQAFAHTPSEKHQISSISEPTEAWAHLREIALLKGFFVAPIKGDEIDPDQDGIAIYRIGRRGAPLKHPVAAIYYSTVRLEFSTTVDGQGNIVETAHPIQRSRKWVVMRDTRTVSYGAIERAIPEMELWLEQQ